MFSEILKSLTVTSLAGSILAGLITLAKPFSKKLFGYAWHYYIWLTVLLVMLLPVRFSVPKNEVVPNPVQYEQQTQDLSQIAVTEPEVSEFSEVPAVKNTVPNGIELIRQAVNSQKQIYISLIWLIGVGVFFLMYLLGYFRLLRKIHRNSVEIDCPEIRQYTAKKIRVRICDEISMPFMTGVFSPMLILPKRALSAAQLDNILRHEMTHFRRKDILYKWFAALVKCIHWFNPVVYYVVHQINTECEISCDLSVVAQMNEDEEKSYISTILSLLSGQKTKAIPLTTEMAGSKKILKRRFIMIKNKKTTSKMMSVISAVIAIVMLSTTVFASGVLSDLWADDYTIEVINNGEKIELKNKPFIENNTVYLPLREMLNIEGVHDISYNNGYVEFLIYSEKTIEYGGLEYDFWVNRVQIGSVYAYIAGHSHGTTENAEILRVPILKDEVTYVPYDLFDELKESGQGVFEDTVVRVKNNDTALAGTLYRNDELNFKLELPLSWVGKYYTKAYDNQIYFVHSQTNSITGRGNLFSVAVHETDEIKNQLDTYPDPYRIAYMDSRYTYLFHVPSDIQYSIAEKDATITAQYKEMAADADFVGDNFIIDSFDILVKSSEYFDNAENLTLDEIQELQNEVDNGHYPWRLDPTQTILEYADKNDLGGGTVTTLAENGIRVRATYAVHGERYSVESFKPWRQDEFGVWITKHFEKSSPIITQERISKAVIECMRERAAEYDTQSYTYNALSQGYDGVKIKVYVEIKPDRADSYDYLTIYLEPVDGELVVSDYWIEK